MALISETYARQIQRATTSPRTATTITNITAALRPKFVAGNSITSDDFVQLWVAMWHATNHSHSYFDLIGIKDVGDTDPGDYLPGGNAFAGQTGLASGYIPLPFDDIRLNDPFSATIINAIIATVNQYRNTHNHSLTDITS